MVFGKIKKMRKLRWLFVFFIQIKFFNLFVKKSALFRCSYSIFFPKLFNLKILHPPIFIPWIPIPAIFHFFNSIICIKNRKKTRYNCGNRAICRFINFISMTFRIKLTPRISLMAVNFVATYIG